MATAYHINGRGEPGVCRAENGGCPFGGAEDHYKSPEEARTAYEGFHQEAVVAAAQRKKPKAVAELSREELEVASKEVAYVADRQVAHAVTRGALVDGKKVEKARVAQKYVYLQLEGEKRERSYARDEAVAVQRPVPTDRSRDAAMRYGIMRGADYAVGDAKENLAKAASAITDRIAKYGEASPGDVERLITAQAKRSIWQRVELRAKETGRELGDEASAYAQELQDEIAKSYRIRTGLNRSSSVVSNIMDDAQNEANLEFLRNFGPNSRR